MIQLPVIPCPSKPEYGTVCNGCGLCCANERCHLSREFLGAGDGLCPALEFEDGRMWCGLVREPGMYFDTSEWSDDYLRRIFSNALGIGTFCDCGTPLEIAAFASDFAKARAGT